MKKSEIIALLIALVALFYVSFKLGVISEKCRIKNTKIDLTIGKKYIRNWSLNDNKNPFKKMDCDTLLIMDIKEGYARYAVLKSDTIGYTSSMELAFLQSYIVDTIK